jgi:hypothetical protein
MTQETLSGFEQTMARNAHHRALIMRILMDHPDGLTVQQIVACELDCFGFTFLTDNRLRELRAKGWVECVGEKPQRWRRKTVDSV